MSTQFSFWIYHLPREAYLGKSWSSSGGQHRRCTAQGAWSILRNWGLNTAWWELTRSLTGPRSRK